MFYQNFFGYSLIQKVCETSGWLICGNIGKDHENAIYLHKNLLNYREIIQMRSQLSRTQGQFLTSISRKHETSRTLRVKGFELGHVQEALGTSGRADQMLPPRRLS